jgi:ketosteroid isomerase-like protein
VSAQESLIEHEVAACRDLFVGALRARDSDKACSVYATDAHLLPPAADAVHGRSEICRYWQAGLDAGVADLVFDSATLTERDGFAYEFGRYVLRLEPVDGTPVVERGHYVQIHQRNVDGAWERALEIFSPGGQQ